MSSFHYELARAFEVAQKLQTVNLGKFNNKKKKKNS